MSIAKGRVAAQASMSLLTQKPEQTYCCYSMDDPLRKIEEIVVGTSTIILLEEKDNVDKNAYVFRLNLPVWVASFRFEDGFGICGAIIDEITEPLKAIDFLAETIRNKGMSFPMAVLNYDVKVGDCLDGRSIGKIKDMINLGRVYQFIFTTKTDVNNRAVVKYMLDEKNSDVRNLLTEFWSEVRKVTLFMHSYFKPKVVANVGNSYCWLDLDFTESIIAIDYGDRVKPIKELKEYGYFDVVSFQKLTPFAILSFPEELVVVESEKVVLRFNNPDRLLELQNNSYIKSFLLKNMDGNDIVLLTPFQITTERR